MRISSLFGGAFALLAFLHPLTAKSQTPPLPPLPPASHRPPAQQSAANEPRPQSRERMPQAAAIEPVPAPAAQPRAGDLLAAVTLADIGFGNGLRFSNLGGNHELYVPLPQDGEVAARELVLVLDDISAYEARRNLEVRVNDRTVTAIMLDGKSSGRTVRVPLGDIKPKDGYLKLSFFYSGAATLDRCFDMRYVGDSVTIRPETAVEIDVGPVGELDVATTAALMPRDVAIVLPGRQVAATEMAAAITVARSLISSGRHVSFYHGYSGLADLAKPDEPGHWTRGIVLIGPLADAVGVVDSPVARVAGVLQSFGTLSAVRIGGQPALLVSDAEAVRAGSLFASPLLAATRSVVSASVGTSSPLDLPTQRVSFDELAVAREQVDVFGRAELSTVVDTRRLPAGTHATRLLLDIMVAPNGANEKAVISVFVNERLLGSTVAATGEATRLDLQLPDGLLGTVANVRALIERDRAQGDCRYETQGYPAQILGSSSLILEKADGPAHDFSDLTPRFAHGIDFQLPEAAADQPTLLLGLVSQVASQLSPVNTPIGVNFDANGYAPTPQSPFVVVSDLPPAGATPRVRFDRGRVVVTDRFGRTLLDLAGFVGGAVAQIVTAGDNSGLWIRPLAADGSEPAPADLHLERGDVAFIDGNGVALAMSSERDTVVRISYPDQVSWLTIAERFRSWIIGGLWLFATAALLLTLQRMFRRRPAGRSD
jgi:cellulose synthase operon protein B